jgi:ferrous iron transport protein A
MRGAGMTLADLNQGQTATVARIAGADDVSVRLMEMGLTPGATATLIGAAPLGDPLEFLIRGYRLSLRKSEAAKVEVQ